MYNFLKTWGLESRFQDEAALFPNLILARITRENRGSYQLVGENGVFSGKVSGKFIYDSNSGINFPAVGDWVLVNENTSENGTAVILKLLSRKSMLVRKAAGSAKKDTDQIVASNIDTLFICMALDNDFNLRRLERYLTIGWDSQAVPVIVLTKSDLCDAISEKLEQVNSIALGVDTVVVSSIEQEGYLQIAPYVSSGKTSAFIGSSGVGKSTLINSLVGEDILDTRSVRDDDSKGRHTTTFRQMFLTPSGAVVIDTPGMRELSLSSGSFSQAFTDIEDLIAQCKFGNCSHNTEPGCAILEALSSGVLDERRYANYKKLQLESSYEGLSPSEVESKKLDRMFGGKKAYKQFNREIKKKNRR